MSSTPLMSSRAAMSGVAIQEWNKMDCRAPLRSLAMTHSGHGTVAHG